VKLRAPGLLALEDGTMFAGHAAGAAGTAVGEICFNTSMTGYQEVLTDPSYHGQIVALTAPHVGNTGVNRSDEQSRRPWVAGLVVREAASAYSSWRAEGGLHAYLCDHRIVALTDVDTRRLTRHVRARGAMRAALSTEALNADELVDVARCAAAYGGRDLVADVSTKRAYRWDGDGAPASGPRVGARPRVAAFDYGIKRNILRLLALGGCEVTVLPAHASADDVFEGGFSGVFLSNGPGDPEPLHYAVRTVARLLGRVPVFGICLGVQILALAVGGRTFKLPFGHRGANHPVKRLSDGAVEVTCQNHGFAVDASSLGASGAVVSHVNLNDDTIEGLEVPGIAFGVQYHPEAAPGPHDSRYLFERFVDLMEGFENRAMPRSVTA
jgi:carbamoyl-phosphate synthase small subunit